MAPLVGIAPVKEEEVPDAASGLLVAVKAN
jgi:hypothetical protein